VEGAEIVVDVLRQKNGAANGRPACLLEGSIGRGDEILRLVRPQKDRDFASEAVLKLLGQCFQYHRWFDLIQIVNQI
jgi:hypothetical protein